MKYVFALSATMLFFACAKREICYVSANDPQTKKDSVYTFENDTVRIRYAFWGERGVIGFSVYNKLSKPIYIDWKKSAYVINGVKYNYWSDRTIVSSRSASVSLPIASTYGWYGSVGGSTTEMAAPERVTFLAPRSLVIYYSGLLWTGTIKPLPASAASAAFTITNGKHIQARQLEYSSTTSPIRFRNFITFSVSENFADESYIDNGFYVSKIVEVKPKYLASSWHETSDGRYMVHEAPFRMLTGFYLSTTPVSDN